LLHLAVLKGAQGKVAFLIKAYIELEQATPDQVNLWVNRPSQNHNSFTPLHFASFKSNFDAIIVLLNYGADKNAVNGDGLNMLHVAAQGNSAPSLYFFKQLGLDINS